jgi:gamma-glutamyl hydrolase
VKWLEAAGARVTPIQFDVNVTSLDTLLGNVNGILFTGGELTLSPNSTYYKTADHIYQWVLKTNGAGTYFPLWGTCMGFQLLNILTASNYSVLSHSIFDSEHMSLPLELSTPASDSRLLSQMDPALLRVLTETNITENLHHDGVLPSVFQQTPRLRDFYRLVSTNCDRRGLRFVSTIEAFHAPVYGTQWHPERPQFDWTPGIGANHSQPALGVMQYFANFLVSEARRNDNSFPSHEQEQAALIYNFDPIHTHDSAQVYIFG